MMFSSRTGSARGIGPDDIPGAILRAQQLGADHYVPLLRAVHQRRLRLLTMTRATPAGLVKRFLAVARGPTLIVIGDDDYQSTGPDGWPAVRRTLAWARQVLIHGSGAHASEYAVAALAAELVGRFVLIECSSETAPAWMQAAERYAQRTAPKHAVLPHDGLQHPVRETVQ